MRYVYMLRGGESHYKVGVSGNLLDRLKSIQTGSPYTIEIVLAVPIANPTNAEKELHKWLNEFKADGGREWFKLDSDKAIELAIKLTGMGIELSQYLSLRSLEHRQKVIENKFTQFTEKMNSLLERHAKLDVFIDADTGEEIKNPDYEKPMLDGSEDELLPTAENVVRVANRASASYLQRRLRIGYTRAARLLDALERNGVIGPGDGAKPREVLPYKLPTPVKVSA